MKKMNLILAVLAIIFASLTGKAQATHMQKDSVDMMLRKGKNLIENHLKKETCFRIDSLSESFSKLDKSNLNSSYKFSSIDDIVSFSTAYLKEHANGIYLVGKKSGIKIEAFTFTYNGNSASEKSDKESKTQFFVIVNVNTDTTGMGYTHSTTFNSKEPTLIKSHSDFMIMGRGPKYDYNIQIGDDLKVYGHDYKSLLSFLCKNG